MAKRRYCRGVNMTMWDKIFAWLLIIGGLVHGIDAFNYMLLDAWFGQQFGNIVQGVVGFSAVWIIIRSFMGFK